MSSLLQAARVFVAQFLEVDKASRSAEHFFTQDVQLSQLSTQPAGIPIAMTGYGVTALVDGSSPAASVLLQLNGKGDTRFLAPGTRVVGPFSSLVVKPMPGAPQVGLLRLQILRSPFASWDEGKLVQPVISPTALLGTVGPTGVIGYSGPFTEDTDPTDLLTTSGVFDVSGWHRTLVFVDCNSNGGNATSWSWAPWFCPKGSAGTANATYWSEQGTVRISVPDSDTTGYRFRVVSVDWDGSPGFGFLRISNLLAAARTGLSYCVVGVG